MATILQPVTESFGAIRSLLGRLNIFRRNSVDAASTEDLRQTAALLSALTTAGVISIVLCSMGRGVATFGGCCLIAGAALVAGALAGFLFGIPITRSSLRDVSNARDTHTQQEEQGYKPNTNLEEISDWLTKIIVGVGLTQLKEMPGALVRVSRYLALLAGADQAHGEPIVLAILLYFAVAGFFWGYLLTRMFLSPAFFRLESLRKEVAKVAKNQERLLQKQQDLSRKLTEGELYDALYQPAPGGFETAIETGEVMINRDPSRDGVWYLLACAYGQKYAYLKSHESDSQTLQEVRHSALDAARKAIELDPNNRGGLRSLLTAENPKEDDLASFRGDSDFEKLLGLKDHTTRLPGPDEE